MQTFLSAIYKTDGVASEDVVQKKLTVPYTTDFVWQIKLAWMK